MHTHSHTHKHIYTHTQAHTHKHMDTHIHTHTHTQQAGRSLWFTRSATLPSRESSKNLTMYPHPHTDFSLPPPPLCNTHYPYTSKHFRIYYLLHTYAPCTLLRPLVFLLRYNMIPYYIYINILSLFYSFIGIPTFITVQLATFHFTAGYSLTAHCTRQTSLHFRNARVQPG